MVKRDWSKKVVFTTESGARYELGPVDQEGLREVLRNGELLGRGRLLGAGTVTPLGAATTSDLLREGESIIISFEGEKEGKVWVSTPVDAFED